MSWVNPRVVDPKDNGKVKSSGGSRLVLPRSRPKTTTNHEETRLIYWTLWFFIHFYLASLYLLLLFIVFVSFPLWSFSSLFCPFLLTSLLLGLILWKTLCKLIIINIICAVYLSEILSDQNHQSLFIVAKLILRSYCFLSSETWLIDEMYFFTLCINCRRSCSWVTLALPFSCSFFLS